MGNPVSGSGGGIVLDCSAVDRALLREAGIGNETFTQVNCKVPKFIVEGRVEGFARLNNGKFCLVKHLFHVWGFFSFFILALYGQNLALLLNLAVGVVVIFIATISCICLATAC